MNRKSKICFISPKAYPIFDESFESVFGGAEIDLATLARELAKNDNFEVSLVVADYGQDDTISKDNIRIIKSLNFKQYQIISVIKIWKALKKANSDIYIIKTASLGVFLTYLFCKFHKKKFVYRTASRREVDGSYAKEHPLLGKLFEYSLKKCDKIFCQNTEDKSSLKERLNLDSIVIPNAHYIPDSKLDKKIYTLWVGRSAAVKRPDLFLKLAKQNPEESFVMICQEATGDRNYRSLIKEASQIANLTFIQRVPYNEIDNYFAKAKLLVNTSDSEGFPNTFIEAGKHSVPLLSLNVNPDNYINKYKTGKFAQGDWDKFQEYFKLLMEETNNTEFAENNYNYVKEKHDISKIIELYKKAFMDILHG